MVSSVVIGARTPEQLQGNLAAADLKLGAEELDTLSAVSATSRPYPARAVNLVAR